MGSWVQPYCIICISISWSYVLKNCEVYYVWKLDWLKKVSLRWKKQYCMYHVFVQDLTPICTCQTMRYKWLLIGLLRLNMIGTLLKSFYALIHKYIDACTHVSTCVFLYVGVWVYTIMFVFEGCSCGVWCCKRFIQVIVRLIVYVFFNT